MVESITLGHFDFQSAAQEGMSMLPSNRDLFRFINAKQETQNKLATIDVACLA